MDFLVKINKINKAQLTYCVTRNVPYLHHLKLGARTISMFPISVSNVLVSHAEHLSRYFSRWSAANTTYLAIPRIKGFSLCNFSLSQSGERPFRKKIKNQPKLFYSSHLFLLLFLFKTPVLVCSWKTGRCHMVNIINKVKICFDC